MKKEKKKGEETRVQGKPVGQLRDDCFLILPCLKGKAIY
jgi:hypothetical protein